MQPAEVVFDGDRNVAQEERFERPQRTLLIVGAVFVRQCTVAAASTAGAPGAAPLIRAPPESRSLRGRPRSARLAPRLRSGCSGGGLRSEAGTTMRLAGRGHGCVRQQLRESRGAAVGALPAVQLAPALHNAQELSRQTARQQWLRRVRKSGRTRKTHVCRAQKPSGTGFHRRTGAPTARKENAEREERAEQGSEAERGETSGESGADSRKTLRETVGERTT